MPTDAEIRGYQPPAGLLAGRVIAITGAGDGIGRALALAAARLGAEVVLIGRTVRRLEAVEAEIAAPDGEGTPRPPRASRRSTWKRRWPAITTSWRRRCWNATGGSMDWCTTPPCSARLSPIEHADMRNWVRVLHVNLTAAFALTQVLLPALRASQDASVIFTSSSVGRRGRANWGAYAVSKFGVEGLSQVLADELDGNSRDPRQCREPRPDAHAHAPPGLSGGERRGARGAGRGRQSVPLAAGAGEPRCDGPEPGLPAAGGGAPAAAS